MMNNLLEDRNYHFRYQLRVSFKSIQAIRLF